MPFIKKHLINQATAEIRYEKKFAFNIKRDSKSFYAYVRSKQKVRDNVGPLEGSDGDTIIIMHSWHQPDQLFGTDLRPFNICVTKPLFFKFLLQSNDGDGLSLYNSIAWSNVWSSCSASGLIALDLSMHVPLKTPWLHHGAGSLYHIIICLQWKCFSSNVTSSTSMLSKEQWTVHHSLFDDVVGEVNIVNR